MEPTNRPAANAHTTRGTSRTRPPAGRPPGEGHSRSAPRPGHRPVPAAVRRGLITGCDHCAPGRPRRTLVGGQEVAMSLSNSVVAVMLPTGDAARAQEFYEKRLGLPF